MEEHPTYSFFSVHTTDSLEQEKTKRARRVADLEFYSLARLRSPVHGLMIRVRNKNTSDYVELYFSPYLHLHGINRR